MTVTIKTKEGRIETDRNVILVSENKDGSIECIIENDSFVRIATTYESGAIIVKVEA